MFINTLLLIFVGLSAYIAYKVHALTRSGAFTAFFIGAAILLGTGLKGLFLLGIFFVTSSFGSKWKTERKETVTDIVAKDGERDWAQVFANGAVPSLFSIIYYFQAETIWLVAFSVAIAAANADTWASEVGVLSRKEPIFLFTGKRVKRGTSGAVSLLGTTAGLFGAAIIGLFAYFFWLHELTVIHALLIIFTGFLGMVIDTMIGYTLQEKFICVHCKKVTEKIVHCGERTRFIRGIRFMNNDVVNFLSSLSSAFLCIYLLN